MGEVNLLQDLLVQGLQQHLPQLQEQTDLPLAVAGGTEEAQEQLAFIRFGILLPTIEEPHEPAIGLAGRTVFAKLH